jgi:hypothetical protein
MLEMLLHTTTSTLHNTTFNGTECLSSPNALIGCYEEDRIPDNTFGNDT